MSAISLFAVLAVVTDTLCPQVMAPVEAADVHVRCRVPWRLEWRDAASGEARCLAIDVSHDNIYGDKASVEYVAGTDSVLARWDIDAKEASGPVSLRIAKDLYGTHLYAVNGEELMLDGGDTDIDFAVGSAIVARYDSRVRPHRKCRIRPNKLWHNHCHHAVSQYAAEPKTPFPRHQYHYP